MSQLAIIDITGTYPVIPTQFDADSGFAIPILNVLEILGETVVAGTTPVQTVGSGNTITTQIQISQAIAAADATKIGLSAFDSAAFSVDASGFVTLMGGGVAATNIDVDAHTVPGTDPVVPNGSGNITITGAQVATGTIGTNVIRTNSLAANSLTIEIQRSTAVAATDATKNGVVHFDSSAFSVDANGFVTLSGGSGPAVDSFAPNSGTNPVVPTAAGLVNLVGTGSLTVVGSLNTLTAQLTGLTANAVLYGQGTATIGLLASGTTGQVLQTNTGAAPTYSTATYPSTATGTGTIMRADGTNWVATTATYPATTTINQLLYSSSANVISGLATANNAVLTTGATGIPQATALSANGQLIIGSGSGAPIAATLTAGTGISITNAANSITVAVTGSGVGQTITGDSGGALSPTAGNWNIVGSGSIATSGSVSTLTVALTGLTNHALLVGAGTSTITKVGPSATTGQVLQSQGAAADPAFSTATYPATATGTGTILRADGTNWVATTATYPNTTTINQLLYSSSANVIAGVTNVARALLTTDSSGIPTWRALTDGQFVIGSSSSQPIAANITAGTGISVTNGANSITIASTLGGFSWTDVTGASQAISVQNGYITDRGGGVSYSLPTTAAIGDTFIIMGKLGITTITQAASQQILIGSGSSTVGATGTCVGNNVGDCITLVCITANNIFRASSVIGTWTLS